MMTENVWQDCTRWPRGLTHVEHWESMLDHLRQHCGAARRKAGRRKLRLLACATCRRVQHLLRDRRSLAAIDFAEQMAEGPADRGQQILRHAEALEAEREMVAANEADPGMTVSVEVWPAFWAVRSAWMAVEPQPFLAALGALSWAGPCLRRPEDTCSLVREIFGNPFRPLPSRSFPPHIVGLAKECYESLPTVGESFLILADALTELGEDHAAAHCREPLHFKGCHVIDWLLAKG